MFLDVQRNKGQQLRFLLQITFFGLPPFACTSNKSLLENKDILYDGLQRAVLYLYYEDNLHRINTVKDIGKQFISN